MTETLANPDLLYEPPPEVSKEFTAEFNRIVPFVGDTLCRQLRYVWGMDRLEYVAGFWERRYGDTVNDPAKYVGKPRWILEGWQSPDVYDRAEWEESKHLLGDWPENGVWDFIEVHETADGEFLPLDNTAIERVQTWHFWRSKGAKRSIEHLMEQKMLRWSLQQQRREEKKAEVSTKFGEDIVRALDNFSNPVSTSGKNIGAFKKTKGGILVKI